MWCVLNYPVGLLHLYEAKPPWCTLFTHQKIIWMLTLNQALWVQARAPCTLCHYHMSSARTAANRIQSGTYYVPDFVQLTYISLSPQPILLFPRLLPFQGNLASQHLGIKLFFCSCLFPHQEFLILGTVCLSGSDLCVPIPLFMM